ncbi:Aurofusarin cluster transcription factor aurR2 [Lachnellula suecica]|uniref:Aurofusarin cluster transcription factor aurR2 n=1 Tax=Lachnellula suecica TaxID=602035 RepID=A0A8T9C0H2_9HELO|nr:Aurofusarin cluster transcription factor aurR2 [Lachnellula suecica]
MSTTEENRSKSPSGNEPFKKKHPCILCQQRKVKCDRNDPCQNCTKARVECISASTMPPKRRKKRFPEAELLARLKKYEAHLKAYGADIDAINREDGPPAPKESAEAKHIDSHFDCNNRLSVRKSLRHVENNMWHGLNQEFRDAEELLQGSSDDEDFESPITKTYDTIGSDARDLLFSAQPPDSLVDFHPTPMNIFRLWQTFIDNVNPLIKIFHAPTVQQQILDASADLGKLSKKTEVLMFGIYSTAVQSLDDQEVKSMFAEEKSTLLAQYQTGCRHSLQRAGFLRTSDITILQGFVLYLTSCLNFTMDPRALYCLTGITVRIAQRMGLNVDGTAYGLPPFEVEMRRRLWWQVLHLDNRVGELSGAGPSLHMHRWTTKLPSNVNDSSLFPDMKDPPVEHPGATEMIFVLQKCELAQFVHQMKRVCRPTEVKDETVDAFETLLENKYLKYCDSQVPLHYLSLLMARAGLNRIRMGPLHFHLSFLKRDNTTDEEKDKCFLLTLTMLEYHHTMMGAKPLSRYLWHIYTNFPFPAHVYILCALRYKPMGELSDRAWRLLEESFERRSKGDFNKKNKHKGSALHMAMSNLTLKAWEARERVCYAKTPEYILTLKQDLAAARKTPSSADASPPEGFGNQLEDAYQWFDQQPYDQSGIVMPESMDWSLWNGVPMAFDNTMDQGFYKS